MIPLCYFPDTIIHRHTSAVTRLKSLKMLKRQCVRVIHAFKRTNLTLLRETITNKSLVMFSVKVGTKKYARFLASVCHVFVVFVLQGFCGAQLVLAKRSTGATYRFQLQGSISSVLDSLTFEDGTVIFYHSAKSLLYVTSRGAWNPFVSLCTGIRQFQHNTAS